MRARYPRYASSTRPLGTVPNGLSNCWVAYASRRGWSGLCPHKALGLSEKTPRGASDSGKTRAMTW